MTSSQKKARNSQTDKLSYIQTTGSCSHCKLNRETETVEKKVH